VIHPGPRLPEVHIVAGRAVGRPRENFATKPLRINKTISYNAASPGG
jgi:hypothetical protein